MKYLLRFHPLEGYSFGTDQNAVYAGMEEGRTGKESYYLTSLELPAQTTLLGVLRRTVLKKEGLLRPDFNYSDEEIQKINNAIGKDSFSFETARTAKKEEEQSFGLIKSLSPVFLEGEDGSLIIPNPFCNSAADSYAPYPMGDKLITSHGEVVLPSENSYKTKDGHGSGFFDIVKMKTRPKLFRHEMLPGNRKAYGEKDRDDAYYRREVVYLKQGFCFSVLAEVEGTKMPKWEEVYMGKKRSAVALEALELGKDCTCFDTGMGKNGGIADLLGERVKAAFKNAPGGWYYALSDIFIPSGWVPSSFCIMERKSLRNLETVYASGSGRLRRSQRSYGLVAAGSVFFGDPDIPVYTGLQKLGYNHIIKLGGDS